MFEYKTEIKLHHTDAAGILFFSHQFTLAHDAYQAFMDQISLPLSGMLMHSDWYLPIVHADAGYRMPLRVEQKITIRLSISRIGGTSFTIHYRFLNGEDGYCGDVSTVHVCVDRATGKKRDLPDEVRNKLQPYLRSAD